MSMKNEYQCRISMKNQCHRWYLFGSTTLSALGQNPPGNDRFWGEGLELWVTVLQFEEDRPLLCLRGEQKRWRQTDGKWETESCGNGDLKGVDLAWGAGKQSIQNKWEVNMQPQEAINCSRDQLGPSRCSWPPALVLPHLGVCDGASPSLSWGDDGCFHLLSNLKGRLSKRRRPPKPLYCALFAPHPPSASH